MSPLGEKIRKSWKSDCGAGTKCCESYLPMTSAQEKRNKCMFPFHPSQEEIKMGKWIFLGPGSRIFWGKLTLFSCSMWDRGGTWASRGTEDALIFLLAQSGSEGRPKLPPKTTEQARQDEQGTKESKKNL